MAETTTVQIDVQVCYATADYEFLRELSVPEGTTIEQAIRRSGLLETVAGIDLATTPVGIFSRKKTLDTVLRAHDRVEVYRPLQADPKETRRRRAGGKAAKA